MLKYKSDISPPEDRKLLIVHLGNLFSPNNNFAKVRHIQTSQHIQKRRFSTSAGSNDGDKLSLPHCKADTVQCFCNVGLFSIIFFQVLCFQNIVHNSSVLSVLRFFL